jgi:hypothetical protein
MNIIVSEVELIRKYIKKPEIKKLYEKNKAEYEIHLKDKFKNFSENKPFLFDMAISQERFEFDKLKEFCSLIDKVNSGKMTSENASKYIGQKYYDKYVKNKVEDKVEEIETNENESNNDKREDSSDEPAKNESNNDKREDSTDEPPKDSRNKLNLKYV